MRGENTAKNMPKGFRTHVAKRLMNPMLVRSANGIELQSMVNSGYSVALRESVRRQKKRSKRKGE